MSFFTNIFRGAQQATYQQPSQPQQHLKTPPASSNVIRYLPIVNVTADDLVDEANRECAVCLEEQNIGSLACKLPCGHLYHRSCVRDWLLKSCTCPVCRYELETDDPTYEIDRKRRMRSRRLRMRLDELESKRVGRLKELAEFLNVNIDSCIDKKEIIDKLLASGNIDITEGAPPIELGYDEFMAKGVGELRTLLRSFGLSDEGALEKSELRARLIESRRILIIATNPSVERSSSTSINHEPNPTTRFSIAELKLMTTHKLQDLCARAGLSISGLAEREALLELLLESDVCIKGENTGLDQNMDVDGDYVFVRQENGRRVASDQGASDVNTASADNQNISLDDAVAAAGGGYSGLSRSSSQFRMSAPPTPQAHRHGISSPPDLQQETVRSSRAEGETTTNVRHNQWGGREAFVIGQNVLDSMSIRELKSILTAYNISCNGCLEKEDIIEKMRLSDCIQIV